MEDAEGRFDVQPSVGNHFAWLRTQMALQRTQLAGVRTAVSLIGFGFTVAQFFQKLQSNSGLNVVNPAMPRNIGLVLIAAGVVSLLWFIMRCHELNNYLRSAPFAAITTSKTPLLSATYLMSWAVVLIGILAFGSVFLKF